MHTISIHKIQMETAVNILQSSYAIAREIRAMVSKMQWAAEERDRVCQRIKSILCLLDQLMEQSHKEMDHQIQKIVKDTNQQLRACIQICEDMEKQNKLMKFMNAYSHSDAIAELEMVLDQAIADLNVALTCFNAAQIRKLGSQLDQAKLEVKRDILHPTAGAYPVKAGTLKPPAKVGQPMVDVEGDQMIISWDDPNNYQESVDGYEVRYDDVHNFILPVPTNKYKSISLGSPKVTPGKVYTIQVRAINGRGPGEWSEHTIARFKTGPPNKPDKPSVKVGTTSAKVTVIIPEPEKCNGAPVNKAIVEYCETDNSCQWNSREKAVCNYDNMVVFEIEELPANTIHLFRIKLANEFGKSQPSEPVQIQTQVPIPGVPTEVRQSTYYTSSLLKIRWEPPLENPAYVDKYVVRYKKKKKEFDRKCEFQEIKTTSKKLSATAKHLKSDTKYIFHVAAFNSLNESCGHIRIEAETRWHKAAKAMLSPLVFAGATVASPLLGTVGGVVVGGTTGGLVGGATGSAIYDKSDTKIGKGTAIGVGVATGVGAGATGAIAGGVGGAVVGTVGAPVIGGVVAHRFIRGSNDYSDQTDEDD